MTGTAPVWLTGTVLKVPANRGVRASRASPEPMLRRLVCNFLTL
jgi:hypothetical protein